MSDETEPRPVLTPGLTAEITRRVAEKMAAREKCRHCGDPIRQGETGDWAHIAGPGSVLYNCQHTVPYGQRAEPVEETE